MTYRVELAVQVEDALATLPDAGRQEVMETIAAALVRLDAWPDPGGWDAAVRFGSRSWVMFSAYLDGIDIIDVGWVGCGDAWFPMP
ncbi:hypothetical protein AQI88_29735 [Streptomyces cellostaticus]|uniref:Uncharacterized protein n=1 Tax=Streptomyces cellostaticus TaxID=67285 RepID=A0A101NGU7_9ACTN|nr:hypothetical protein [Streptomyces cellostaticus]KUM92875.1 hypothetical protein AQI88_29735 [Streptomyces cellostaticus]GHI04601.1 hypothetical protein Scel_29220 [Streptomyces cellostaticus]